VTTPACGVLFHFTHIDNLPSLLEDGALLSDTTVTANGLLSTEAGNPEIKQRRRERPVTCRPGGVVGDYVPFYFASRSPMMYQLWQGGVPTFTGDHRDLVYLVSRVDLIVESGLEFVISDRNAAKALADFTDDVTLLGDLTSSTPQSQFIDWPLMRARMWRNTPGDGERMERRMAEFLVLDAVPFDLLEIAAVQSDRHKAMVEHLFASVGLDLQVVTRPDWYYP
jgi:hypothetical protein